ncbi:hypothetical protein ON010_g12855 [Phytophthora cinnamomi]|nr:hypothetical protein ON010_g12855 [Phytophthora cinnamomi]
MRATCETVSAGEAIPKCGSAAGKLARSGGMLAFLEYGLRIWSAGRHDRQHGRRGLCGPAEQDGSSHGFKTGKRKMRMPEAEGMLTVMRSGIWYCSMERTYLHMERQPSSARSGARASSDLEGRRQEGPSVHAQSSRRRQADPVFSARTGMDPDPRKAMKEEDRRGGAIGLSDDRVSGGRIHPILCGRYRSEQIEATGSGTGPSRKA